MIVVYTRCSGILLEQKGILVIFAEYIFLLLLLYIFFFRRSININERKKKSKTYVILMYGNMYNISINVGILSNIFIDRPICLHPGTTTKIFKLYLFLSSSSSSSSQRIAHQFILPYGNIHNQIRIANWKSHSIPIDRLAFGWKSKERSESDKTVQAKYLLRSKTILLLPHFTKMEYKGDGTKTGPHSSAFQTLQVQQPQKMLTVYTSWFGAERSCSMVNKELPHKLYKRRILFTLHTVMWVCLYAATCVLYVCVCVFARVSVCKCGKACSFPISMIMTMKLIIPSLAQWGCNVCSDAG